MTDSKDTVLDLREIARLLHNTTIVLRQRVTALPDRAVARHPGSEKWRI
jgi:hypothetical protein